MIDFGVNPVYAVPVLLIEGTGLASCNTSGTDRNHAVFLCAKFSTSLLCRAGWAIERLAGACTRKANLSSPAPRLASCAGVKNIIQAGFTMNTQLIPVFAGEMSGVSVQLVDARLLHSFLESAQEFTNWIKNRIEEYGFIENVDFLLDKIIKQRGRGGHNKINYHLTLDMAKELSMVERNEKGKQARRYFIECEQHLLKAASNHHEKAEVITLADIERLIDQKLNAQKPAPQISEPKSTHIRNTTSSGVKFPEPAPGCIRCISDIDIAQLARELAVQGYRISRI